MPEVEKLLRNSCPYDVKGGMENKVGKVNILMQVGGLVWSRMCAALALLPLLDDIACSHHCLHVPAQAGHWLSLLRVMLPSGVVFPHQSFALPQFMNNHACVKLVCLCGHTFHRFYASLPVGHQGFLFVMVGADQRLCRDL